MAAPKGNQFWKLRAKHGTDKLFKDPKLLWESACEYFDWCDQNPWKKHEAVKAGDHFGKTVTAPVSRPYTLSGLCLYLDCDQETFNSYKKEKDFFAVIVKIKEIIYTQKFEGAAVGSFNANLISRDLGLVDERNIKQKVVQYNSEPLSKEELDKFNDMLDDDY